MDTSVGYRQTQLFVSPTLEVLWHFRDELVHLHVVYMSREFVAHRTLHYETVFEMQKEERNRELADGEI